MSAIDKGQVSKNAAEVYEDFFLPALFQPWARPVVAAAQIRSGDRVLDVACGTGVLARAALEEVGPSGAVVGLDVNTGMLDVAKVKAPSIEWREGKAERLPFETATFDKVVSQYGLMFFDDKIVALKEMARVLKPSGRLVVAVWDSLDNTPGYAAMTGLLRRLFGDDAARGLEAPYSLGDKAQLRRLFERAGLVDADLQTRPGTAQFASLEAWVHTDIKGWTLADVINGEPYERLLTEAKKDLSPFVDAKGQVVFEAPAHFVMWQKQDAEQAVQAP